MEFGQFGGASPIGAIYIRPRYDERIWKRDVPQSDVSADKLTPAELETMRKILATPPRTFADKEAE